MAVISSHGCDSHNPPHLPPQTTRPNHNGDSPTRAPPTQGTSRVGDGTGAVVETMPRELDTIMSRVGWGLDGQCPGPCVLVIAPCVRVLARGRAQDRRLCPLLLARVLHIAYKAVNTKEETLHVKHYI